MNYVDWAALGIVAFNAILGWKRGLSGELARLISVGAACALGLAAYRPLGAWLLHHTRASADGAKLLAFLAAVAGAVLLMVLIRLTLGKIASLTIEEGPDKWLGVVAALIRSVACVLIVFVAVNMWPNKYLNRHFGRESVIGRTVLRAMPAVRKDVGWRGGEGGRWAAVGGGQAPDRAAPWSSRSALRAPRSAGSS